MFKKYIHLERYSTDAVEDITLGTCYVFPKIDGTNASIWNEDGQMQCGSRNRQLSAESDNAGFYAWATQQEKLKQLILEFPNWIFYGEWLVPHSLKTYRDDCWRNFYIFDVVNEEGKFLHYDVYSEILKAREIPYIPCYLSGKNLEYETLVKCTQENTYLLNPNSGCGEGIVIKRYDYVNRYGNTIWAKLITTIFKEVHISTMGGVVKDTTLVEEEIVKRFLTKHLVDKVVAKIREVKGEFSARDIPQLLGQVYYELVTEELWNAIKEFKSPLIDFRTLNTFCIAHTKKHLPELFGIS